MGLKLNEEDAESSLKTWPYLPDGSVPYPFCFSNGVAETSLSDKLLHDQVRIGQSDCLPHKWKKGRKGESGRDLEILHDLTMHGVCSG